MIYPIFKISNYMSNILRFTEIVCLNIFHRPIRLQAKSERFGFRSLVLFERNKDDIHILSLFSAHETRDLNPNPAGFACKRIGPIRDLVSRYDVQR